MNIKQEIINGLKNLLGHFSKTYTEGELQISSKEVGGKVEQVQPDGSLAPVEDGDYPMEDGMTYVVKDGLITEIKSPEQPEDTEVVSVEDSKDKPEEDKEEEKMEDVPAEEPVQPEEDSKVTELEGKVAELEAKVEEMAKAMESMIAEMLGKEVESLKSETLSAIQQFTKTVEEMNSNIKTLAKTPVEFSKTNDKPSIQDSKHEKMMKLYNILKK